MQNTMIELLIRYRYLLSVITLVVSVALAAGASNLVLNNNYNNFFDDDDEQKLAHERQQEEFTKTENLSFLIQPKTGDVFTVRTLQAIWQATDQAWLTPYAIRVDSLSNYQHSIALEDDLLIEDLVAEPDQITDEDISKIKKVALTETELANRVVSLDGRTTLINISLEFPPYPRKTLSETQWNERLEARQQATQDVIDYGRQLKQKLRDDYPELTVHMMGETVINQSLSESSDKDAATLIPLMFLCVIVLLGYLLRSVGSIVSSLVVIAFTVAATMGLVGWVGFSLNMVNMVAPIIILTIAVCDSVHLLSIYLRNLGQGDTPIDAMRESINANLQPVFITSLTTAVGFLTLNFSASPPFREFGTICAFGVMYAMVLSLCLLPAITILLVRKAKPTDSSESISASLANFIINHQRSGFFITMAVTAVIAMFIANNRVNDDPALYFKPGNDYRDAVDFSQSSLPGINDINFSLNCGAENCINDPSFLAKVQEFGDWLSTQDNVEYVVSYVDVIKRINRNMNQDDERFYALPANIELSAQYNLLYELSLPLGLDLKNLLNYNKSATRITAFTSQVTTGEFIALEQAATQWLDENHPNLGSRGSSIRMMFSTLGENNLRGLFWGAIFALIGVTITIFIALRSVKYALISFVPNCFPAVIALGIWGVLVAQVNVGVAAVFSITLGVIVDDSVHFISKYRRARLEQKASPEDAIRYAFVTVGPALLITTIVLAAGFALLCFSNFNLNAHLGAMTAITVVVALVFDYFVLPPMLIYFDSLNDESVVA